jgi:hypothetical protein
MDTRRFAFALLAALLAGAVPADAPHDHGPRNPHLRMTATRPPTAADEARYAALEATLRRELARYRDVAVAVADGYESFHPERRPRLVHYSKRSHALAAAFGFDPLEPTSLLYRRGPGDRMTLVGVMYTAPWWFDEDELDARVPLAVAPWHQHVDLCVPRSREDERWSERRNGRPVFGPGSPIATEAECVAVGGRFVERRFGWMVHVEAFGE